MARWGGSEARAGHLHSRKGKTEATDRKTVFLPLSSAQVAIFFVFLSFRCLRFVRRRWAAGGELSACSRGWGLRRVGRGPLPPPHCLPAIAPALEKKRGKADDSSRNQKK